MAKYTKADVHLKKSKHKPKLNFKIGNLCGVLYIRQMCTVIRVTQSSVLISGQLSLHIPLPSNRHHQSNGDCLEGKKENHQVCSVQLCNIVCYNCAQCNAHTHELT